VESEKWIVFRVKKICENLLICDICGGNISNSPISLPETEEKFPPLYLKRGAG